VILSDESANWQIAGLRQLDRLVLELDEFAKAMGPGKRHRDCRFFGNLRFCFRSDGCPSISESRVFG
jgi:hypothetical protein